MLIHVLIKPFVIRGLFAFLSIAALAPPANAENAKPSLYKRLPDHVRGADASFFTFTSENDAFGNGEDRNYTNGLRLTYFDYGANIPDAFKFFETIIPTFSINETSSIHYSIGQNMYTPSDITERTPNANERPYAGFLYGSAGLTSLSESHIDDIEISLGVVGPWSFAEEAQELVHDIINADDPSGWDNQLENEPAMILSWQRRWPAALEHHSAGLTSRLIPSTGVSLGNVYTYASLGASVQITPTEHSWQTLPPRVRPAIPGSGFFMVPDDRFSWSIFAGAESRLIGRNIFLDGNSFEDSPSVDKRYGVLDLNAGFSLTYGRTQLAYTLNWRSKEFHGQEEPSLFGSLSIGYRF